MNIHEACAAIIGDKLAHDITADQGIHWTVVAAMTEAMTPKHDEAVAVIRAWNAEREALRCRP